MGFFDNPQIDSSSKNSEESELALRQIFSKNNGFICRPVSPDTGCDFDVELILQNIGASNWHFGIQLKSTEQLNIIDKGKFISYALPFGLTPS